MWGVATARRGEGAEPPAFGDRVFGDERGLVARGRLEATAEEFRWFDWLNWFSWVGR
jgi:hypothetical protein